MNRTQLEQAGWQPAIVSAGEHLQRWVSEKETQGFECHLERILFMLPEGAEGCGDHCGVTCTVCFGEPQFQVYLRRNSASA